MTGDEQRKDGSGASGAAERRRRQAEALRRNLVRRKTQQRARSDAPEPPGDRPAPASGKRP